MKRRPWVLAVAIVAMSSVAQATHAQVAARTAVAVEEHPIPPAPTSFVPAQELDLWSAPVLCPGYGNVPGLAIDSTGNPYIANVQQFLDTCPQRDPNVAEILNDFQIRKDDVLVTSFPCTEPVSQMPVAQYPDELIALQVLRAMYYMDRGQSGHLPWTSGTLYDWMKAKIQGVDIVTGVVGGYCCTTISGRTFFVGGTHDDYDREFDRTWDGISNVMAFYAHERRHMDGNGFPHSSCCGIAYGCDDNYDPTNMSPYGVQWWLEKSWLDGDINVGVGCLSESLIAQDANWHLANANNQYRGRFCYTKPPVLTLPPTPAGPCNPRACTCPAITISPAALPPGRIGSSYRQTLTASGGGEPYTYGVSSGSLPPGLGLSQTGILAGTPTATGSFAFAVSVRDVRACGTTKEYTVSVTQLARRKLRRIR
jgi:hypothetical protein